MKFTKTRQVMSRTLAGEVVGRFLLLLVLWWVLVEGQAAALVPGVAVAALAVLVSVRAFSTRVYRLRWRAVPSFAVFFIGNSVVAGLDVARRLLVPSLPIAPGTVTVELRIPEGAPRWLLANTLSLLPGTLSVELHEQRLEVHCLDAGADITGAVRDAEQRVAKLFGLSMEKA